jgi:signal transduction histidine kinase
MKLNFQQRLIASFLVIFTLFAVGIVIFEQQSARRYKVEALEERLNAYAGGIERFLEVYDIERLDSLLALMPHEMRLTLIRQDGSVVYDNVLAAGDMESHADRPEFREAVEHGRGTAIRNSSSAGMPYLYFAKRADGANAADGADGHDAGTSYALLNLRQPRLVVRVALPYDIEVRSFIKPDNGFLYFVVGIFVVGLLFIYYAGRYFGRQVERLRDFDRIRENETTFAREREKLLLHVQTSAEGICFFNPDRTVAFYNGLFLHYFNMLSDDVVTLERGVIAEDVLPGVAGFLDSRGRENYFESRISKHGKEFQLRLNIFEDLSFEVILVDVTEREKTRRLKREMTGNIAHELRTPVTSIRGFLEIVLTGDGPGAEKSRQYLERAYSQTRTLSELIADMSLLARIDERRDAFDFSEVDIASLLDKIHSDASRALEEKQIGFLVDIPDGLTVLGNESLLYSVFRNLTDNVIAHAGEGVEIRIGASVMDANMVRFTFADNGRGISNETHLGKLFERFYRVNEGRTRDTGGSGLGLSIVKNTIALHGGNITVRNNKPHGLEFVFVLPVR